MGEIHQQTAHHLTPEPEQIRVGVFSSGQNIGDQFRRDLTERNAVSAKAKGE